MSIKPKINKLLSKEDQHFISILFNFKSNVTEPFSIEPPYRPYDYQNLLSNLNYYFTGRQVIAERVCETW